MSETAEQVQLSKSPLHVVYTDANVQMVAVDGWLMPAGFSDLEQEYAAVRESGAGIVDLSSRGRLRITGTEAVMFLNGLITNDMKTLAENHWMPAVFPNVQGRLIASVRVMRTVDEQREKGATPVFLLDTEPLTHDRVLQTLSRFTLAGDFQVEDITHSTACLSVQGKDAARIVSKLFGIEIQDGKLLQSHRFDDTQVFVVHATHTGEDGYDIIVENSGAVNAWQKLVGAGAIPVGENALEVLRVEAGIPKFGVDMDENLVVSETNLDDAVSFTKGCYIGQEIIARIKYRGHVAKKITGLILDAQEPPEAKLLSQDSKEIGLLTSVAFSPKLDRWIALGVIKYNFLKPGTQATVINEGSSSNGVVTELPFVKGSWQQRHE